jgi:hypothetical protein
MNKDVGSEDQIYNLLIPSEPPPWWLLQDEVDFGGVTCRIWKSDFQSSRLSQTNLCSAYSDSSGDGFGLRRPSGTPPYESVG